MKTLVVIMTYEPTFELQGSEKLMDYYRQNFDSYHNPVEAGPVTFCVSDFGSSDDFKTFLRSYADERGWYLIDSPQEASIFVAFNSALKSFSYDFVLYATSDVRVRDRYWLSYLLADCEDPKTGMVQSTVTMDGYFFQVQPGPIDRASRILKFPEILNGHFMFFPKSVFEPFDNRIPDIFDTNSAEYCLFYLIAALGMDSKLNFRLNIIHDRFHEGRRHHRLDRSNWKIRDGIYEKDIAQWRLRQYFLPVGRFSSSKFNWFNPLRAYRALRYHVVATRREGWEYWFFKLFRQAGYKNFTKLDKRVRIGLVKVLFFRPLEDYQKYQFTIYRPTGQDRDRLPRSEPVRAVP